MGTRQSAAEKPRERHRRNERRWCNPSGRRSGAVRRARGVGLGEKEAQMCPHIWHIVCYSSRFVPWTANPRPRLITCCWKEVTMASYEYDSLSYRSDGCGRGLDSASRGPSGQLDPMVSMIYAMRVGGVCQSLCTMHLHLKAQVVPSSNTPYFVQLYKSTVCLLTISPRASKKKQYAVNHAAPRTPGLVPRKRIRVSLSQKKKPKKKSQKAPLAGSSKSTLSSCGSRSEGQISRSLERGTFGLHGEN